MKKENLHTGFAVKTLCIIFLIALLSGTGFCDNAPKPKPAIKPHPSKLPGVKKPWTDYVIDYLEVKRDSQGLVQVKFHGKNLGDINKGPLWLAVGINRPGAEWIELGNGSSHSWYALVDRARLSNTIEVKAKIDSRELVAEVNEKNNTCSVHLAPGVRTGRSSCY